PGSQSSRKRGSGSSSSKSSIKRSSSPQGGGGPAASASVDEGGLSRQPLLISTARTRPLPPTRARICRRYHIDPRRIPEGAARESAEMGWRDPCTARGRMLPRAASVLSLCFALSLIACGESGEVQPDGGGGDAAAGDAAAPDAGGDGPQGCVNLKSQTVED